LTYCLPNEEEMNLFAPTAEWFCGDLGDENGFLSPELAAFVLSRIVLYCLSFQSKVSG